MEYFDSRSENNLSIINHNIRSFNHNFDSLLTCFAPDKLPSIFCLSETRFSTNRMENIEGYNCFHTVRNSNTPAGGISLFIQKNLSSIKIDELSFSNDTIEICTVQTEINSQKLIILGVYRPHSDTIDNFNSLFSDILSNAILRNKFCIVMGDLNICLLKQNNPTLNFSNILYSHHFAPLITKPTRFSPIEGEGPSLLDHIWINKFHPNYAGILNIDITDHLPTFVNLKFPSYQSQEKVKIEFREINEFNKIRFQNLLSQTDWNAIKSQNIDSYTENFINKLNVLYCSAFPLKVKYVSSTNHCNPWITDSIRKLIEAKANYFQLYRLSIVTLEENNRFRNRVNNIIRNHKVKFYSDLLLKCKNDIKETWKIINNILSRKQQNHDIKKLSAIT